MALDQKDIELVERAVYKIGNDIAASVVRCFERLGERVDVAESRVNARFADLEERIEGGGHDVADAIGEVRTEIREALRAD